MKAICSFILALAVSSAETAKEPGKSDKVSSNAVTSARTRRDSPLGSVAFFMGILLKIIFSEGQNKNLDRSKL